MLNWLFGKSNPNSEPDELDRKIAAADARIAAKQKILKQLEESVAKKKDEVERLRETVSKQEKALRRNQN